MSSWISDVLLLDHEKPPKGSLLSVSSATSKRKYRGRASGSVQSKVESVRSISPPRKSSSWISDVLLLDDEQQPKGSLLSLSKSTSRGRAVESVRTRIESIRSMSPPSTRQDSSKHNLPRGSGPNVDERNEVDAVEHTALNISPQDKPREMELVPGLNIEMDKAENSKQNQDLKGQEITIRGVRSSRGREVLRAPDPNVSTVAEKIQSVHYAADPDLCVEGQELTLEDFSRLDEKNQEGDNPSTKQVVRRSARRGRSSSRTRRDGSSGRSISPSRVGSSSQNNRNSDVASAQMDLSGEEQASRGNSRGRSLTKFARNDRVESGTVARRSRSSSRTRGGLNEALETMSVCQTPSSAKQKVGRITAEVDPALTSPATMSQGDISGLKELKEGFSQNHMALESKCNVSEKVDLSPDPGGENPLVTTDNDADTKKMIQEGQEVTLEEFNGLSDVISTVVVKRSSEQIVRRSTRRGRSSSRSRSERSMCSSPDRTVSSSNENRREDVALDRTEQPDEQVRRGRGRSSSRTRYGNNNNLESVVASRRNRSSSRTRGGYNEVLETMSCHRIKPSTEASEVEHDHQSPGLSIQPKPFPKQNQTYEQDERGINDMPLEVIRPSRRGRSTARARVRHDQPMEPPGKDISSVRDDTSSVEPSHLETPKKRISRARSASLTKRVNIFTDYDQKQHTLVLDKTSKLPAISNVPASVYDKAYGVPSSVNGKAYGELSGDGTSSRVGSGVNERAGGLSSDRLARVRSRSKAVLVGEVLGEDEGKVEVVDQFQNELGSSKSPPMSPRRQRGQRSSYNKSLGDVVIARSISNGSENYSSGHVDVERMALRRLSSPKCSRRSTIFLAEDHVEDHSRSASHTQINEIVRHEKSGSRSSIPVQNKVSGLQLPANDGVPGLDLKHSEQKSRYDEMSDSYKDDVSDNLESIYDAGSAVESSTHKSGSRSGRDIFDDVSAESRFTDITDCTDTSDITMDDLRDEAAVMCDRTCHTLDRSFDNIMQMRAFKILSVIGKKGAHETNKLYETVKKVKLDELTGYVDRSYNCFVGFGDAECVEKDEPKACKETALSPKKNKPQTSVEEKA